MHRMQRIEIGPFAQYGYPGAALEGFRKLIEPPHLAPGEPPGAYGDALLGLLYRERPRKIVGELANSHGVHDRGAYVLLLVRACRSVLAPPQGRREQSSWSAWRWLRRARTGRASGRRRRYRSGGLPARPNRERPPRRDLAPSPARPCGGSKRPRRFPRPAGVSLGDTLGARGKSSSSAFRYIPVPASRTKRACLAMISSARDLCLATLHSSVTETIPTSSAARPRAWLVIVGSSL